MGVTELQSWRLHGDRAVVSGLLFVLCLHTGTGMSGWGGCLDGQDIFAMVRENSPAGEVIAELIKDTTEDRVRMSIDGKDANWFLLDGRYLRLNTSPERALDREVQGPLLMAELACYEDDTLQGVYRIMVQILNENDNSPVFAETTVQTLIISELTPVNSILFTVRALDKDDDTIIYSLEQTPDAGYFKIDLPNSGEIVLAKPLDYETKTVLTITIQASEMDTAEHYNTSTTVTLTVLDGDDQYPEFLPCTLLFQDPSNHICANPVYEANVTEGEEDIVLDFSPGPIHAVDGDRTLSSPLSYAILSGNEDGHFLMDRMTGEVRLTRSVKDRPPTPTLHLQVIAYQDDDPRKYTLTTALVRVLAVNHFPPVFDTDEYHGFVIESNSPVSLVNTYGNKALMLHVQDRDFVHGVNPMIHFSFGPTSNHTVIYQVTQEGLLIAKANQLKSKEKHILEVTAVDQESGDTTYATVLVEVLPEGHAVPHSPWGDEHITGCTVGKALALCVLFMTILGCVLCAVSWLLRRHKGYMDPRERGCVAQGKHRNVSLRWFQLMNQCGPTQHMDDVPFNSEDLGAYNPSFVQETQGIYINKDLPPCRGPAPPDKTLFPTETIHNPVLLNNNVSPPANCPSSAPGSPSDVDLQNSTNENVGSLTPSLNTSPKAFVGLQTPTTCLVSKGVHSTPPALPPDSQTTPPIVVPSSPTTIDTHILTVSLIKADTCYYTPGGKNPNKPSFSKPDAAPSLESTLSPKQNTTPPPTKARLVDQPPASSDQAHTHEHKEGSADTGSPSQALRPATNAGNPIGKKVDSESDLDSDDEELFRALTRCNPVFITFNK